MKLKGRVLQFEAAPQIIVDASPVKDRIRPFDLRGSTQLNSNLWQ